MEEKQKIDSVARKDTGSRVNPAADYEATPAEAEEKKKAAADNPIDPPPREKPRGDSLETKNSSTDMGSDPLPGEPTGMSAEEKAKAASDSPVDPPAVGADTNRKGA